jgi:alpha-glucan,water dikinase
MHRYNTCREMLKSRIDQDNRDHVAFLFIWLRYSFTRQLTWQQNYNPKPKDLQGAQIGLTDEICAQFSRLYGK